MLFITPWGLAGLIAIPLILLLYILKQKREKVTVSSLILWQKVLRDMQARTPWQKLRKNLLMFLQILASLLIVLALAGFAMQMVRGGDESVILVVDASLSMSSTDVQPTRLEAAKKDALQYISGLPRDSRVTVVSIAREPSVLLYTSTSKEDVANTIQAIEPTFSYVDHIKAEELLASLKDQEPSAKIVLFSDKPIGVANETIQFSNYQKQTNNLALIRFTHSRSSDILSGMSVIRNQGDSPAEAAVSLYGDGGFLDSQRVMVPANQTQTIWWREIPATVQSLECAIDTEDILMADNHAYDTILSGEPVKVLLITDGNLFLEKVFSLMPDVELTRSLPGEITEYKGYNLYILDGTIPENLPRDGNIIVFAPPQNTLFPVGDWMNTPRVNPKEHALFRYLEHLSFSIGRTRIMEKPQWAEVVMESGGNPVIMDGLINNTQLLIFGFNLHETDLPLKSEFPVLMSNLINEYTPRKGTAVSGVTTGDAVAFRLEPDTLSAKIYLPDERGISVAPPIPPEPFNLTEKPGIYRLEQKKQSETTSTFFAVNLPDEWLMESKEANISENKSGAGVHVPLRKQGVMLTLPLLAAAMMILLLEWWFYANRNYI